MMAFFVELFQGEKFIPSEDEGSPKGGANIKEPYEYVSMLCI